MNPAWAAVALMFLINLLTVAAIWGGVVVTQRQHANLLGENHKAHEKIFDRLDEHSQDIGYLKGKLNGGSKGNGLAHSAHV